LGFQPAVSAHSAAAKVIAANPESFSVEVLTLSKTAMLICLFNRRFNFSPNARCHRDEKK
jgi:hypothetical protein